MRILVVTLLLSLGVFACGGSNKKGHPGSDGGGDGAASDAATDGAQAILDGRVQDAEVPACEMDLDATVEVSLRVTADNERKIYVNGALIDDTAYGWGDPRSYAIQLYRHPSRVNVIAIEGINTSSQGGYDRGILAAVSTGGDAGPSFELVTDAQWKVSETLSEGWTDATFDDSAWSAATEQTALGGGPWGAVAGFPEDAQWIWSYDSSMVSGAKVDGEHVYARRTFHLDLDGNPTAETGLCAD